jgi:hypothetical protein
MMTAASKQGILSKKDLKFLMSLLDIAQGELDVAIEISGDNKSKRAARLRRRQIMRIRLALIDLYK